jgi:hypothetical protein
MRNNVGSTVIRRFNVPVQGGLNGSTNNPMDDGTRPRRRKIMKEIRGRDHKTSCNSQGRAKRRTDELPAHLHVSLKSQILKRVRNFRSTGGVEMVMTDNSLQRRRGFKGATSSLGDGCRTKFLFIVETAQLTLHTFGESFQIKKFISIFRD